MRKFIIIASVMLASCGGSDGPPAPIAQCNGTPKAAVVYVGTAPFPELASVPDACVYSTQATSVAELDAVIAKAVAASGRSRPYLIGAYTSLPLAWRAARPGLAEITSVWFPPSTTSVDGITGSIVSVYLNDVMGNARQCSTLATQLKAQGTPAVCQLWDDGSFTAEERAAAIAQLQLGLAK